MLRHAIKKYLDEIKENKSVNPKFDVSSAYSMSMYGKKMTTDDMIKNFYEKVNETIRSRSTRGLFSAVFDLDDSYVMTELDTIMKTYQDLGFYVKFIAKDQSGFDENLKGRYLFLSWKK